MNNSINDIFENAQPNVSDSNHSSLYTIISARYCLEDFIYMCDECAIEYDSRVPAIIANCRYE